MPLLGGAAKMSGSPSMSGNPGFLGKPYSVMDINLPPTDAVAGIELDFDGGIEEYINAGNQGDIGRWDGGRNR